MGGDTPRAPYRLSHVRPKAERYIKSLAPKMQRRIDQAMRKICDNPFRNRHPLHIRQLRGELEGLFEYRGIHSLRIIYEVFKEEREIEILEVVPHL